MKKVLLLGVALISILGFQSCNGGSSSKETSEAKAEAQSSEASEVYVVNGSESKIAWSGKTLVSSHHGVLHLKGSELTFKEGKLESGSIVADMTSIKSEDLEDAEMSGKLDGHLKNEDFFDVVKYPESKFTITSVKPLEGEYNTELEGNLELKGISKNLSVKAKVKEEGGKLMITTEKFTINRQDFQITYSNGNAKDKVIDDLMDLEVSLTSDKK